MVALLLGSLGLGLVSGLAHGIDSALAHGDVLAAWVMAASMVLSGGALLLGGAVSAWRVIHPGGLPRSLFAFCPCCGSATGDEQTCAVCGLPLGERALGWEADGPGVVERLTAMGLMGLCTPGVLLVSTLARQGEPPGTRIAFALSGLVLVGLGIRQLRELVQLEQRASRARDRYRFRSWRSEQMRARGWHSEAEVEATHERLRRGRGKGYWLHALPRRPACERPDLSPAERSLLRLIALLQRRQVIGGHVTARVRWEYPSSAAALPTTQGAAGGATRGEEGSYRLAAPAQASAPLPWVELAWLAQSDREEPPPLIAEAQRLLDTIGPMGRLDDMRMAIGHDASLAGEVMALCRALQLDTPGAELRDPDDPWLDGYEASLVDPQLTSLGPRA